ncbi:MAG: TonB-dependent receptor [Asticcacaulis sp.]
MAGGTALALALVVSPAMAQSTGASQVATASNPTFNIPSQPLTSAVTAFGDQAGVQVSVDGGLLRGRSSRAVKGQYTPAEALTILLSRTGVTYQWINARSVSLEAAPQASGALQLGTIRVEGAGGAGAAGGNGAVAGWDGTADSVYSTSGSVSVITRETLEAYPGTSPSDILKSVTGVMSGESRNSGGLDVNIRGLQGQGRVPVTVDGAINSTTLYRGYQGTSNRSFVDPDFISTISIEKGPSMGNAIAGGIGGSVTMRTVSADDIVREGETEGLRVRFGISGNSSQPGSAEVKNLLLGNNTLAAWRGTERPEMLEPTGGSASLIYGRKGDRFDIVAGYSLRRAGNYHVGEEGKVAPSVTSQPSAVCASDDLPSNGYQYLYCSRAIAYYDQYGITPFVGGEAVLNTSSKSDSGLLKLTWRFAPDHSIEFGYGGYVSTFGENYPSSIASGTTTVSQAYPLSKTDLHRFTTRYRWNPASELIDLKANVWATQLKEQAASLASTDLTKRRIDTYGADVSNSSRLMTPVGAFTADYGLSVLREEVAPEGKWATNGNPPGREGRRDEVSLFSQFQLEPTLWLKLNAGLRYQKYDLTDEQSGVYYHTTPIDRSEDAVSYSLGATVMPADGLQIFAKYSQAARLPSILEATTNFYMISNPDLHKEEAQNWEVGANYQRANLFTGDDDLGLKFVYFDNKTDGYIARKYIRTIYSMQMYNIDKAQFRGFEANATYRIGDFTVDAGVTQYDRIRFCRPGEACINSSLASDYATNYIPPKVAYNLTLSQNLMDDRLNVGVRFVHRGKRGAAAEPTDSGYAPLIKAMPWRPYTTVDLTGRFKVSDRLSLDASIENLTDNYYVEPLSLGVVPAPGRTFRLSLTGELGGSDNLWPANWFEGGRSGETVDWSGLYIGADFGYVQGKEKATITTLAGASVDNPVDEELENVQLSLHFGHNWQLSNGLVFGVEADMSSAQLQTWTGVLVSEPNNYMADYLAQQGRLQSETYYDWDRLMSVRARLGYAFGNTLVYGAAGVAYMRETQTRNQYVSEEGGNDGISNLTFMSFTEKDVRNRHGWTAGGGIERALGDHWSFRTEYRYTDFGKASFVHPEARAGITHDYDYFDVIFNPDGTLTIDRGSRQGTSNQITGRKVSADARIHSLRAGLTYRF